VCSAANTCIKSIAIVYERIDEEHPWRAYFYEIVGMKGSEPDLKYDKGDVAVNELPTHKATFTLECKVLKRTDGLYKELFPGQELPCPDPANQGGESSSATRDVNQRAQNQARDRQSGAAPGKRRAEMPTPKVDSLKSRRSTSPARIEDGGGDYKCIKWCNGMLSDSCYDKVNLKIECISKNLGVAAGRYKTEVYVQEPGYNEDGSEMNQKLKAACFRDPATLIGGLRNPETWDATPHTPAEVRTGVAVPAPPHTQQLRRLLGYNKPAVPAATPEPLRKVLYVNPVLWDRIESEVKKESQKYVWDGNQVAALATRFGLYQ